MQTMDIFDGISGLVLSYVADDMINSSLTEGETLSIGNANSETFIIIRSGQLNFYRRGDLQKTMESGDFIGETLDSEDGGDNMLVALEDCELLLINKERYYELLSDNALFAKSVIRYMSAS